MELTSGIGVDRAIDAVGIDAQHPDKGPAHERSKDREFEQQVKKVAPEQNPKKGNWRPGNGPSQVLEWIVKSTAKAGTLSIIGVYSDQMDVFPIGVAMNKNLTVHMGNCNHKKYVPKLVDLIRAGYVDPLDVMSPKIEPLQSALDAYQAFDLRQPGWMKVELRLRSAVAAA